MNTITQKRNLEFRHTVKNVEDFISIDLVCIVLSANITTHK